MKGKFLFGLTPPWSDWLIGMEYIPRVTINIGEEVTGSMFSIGILIFRLDYFKTEE